MPGDSVAARRPHLLVAVSAHGFGHAAQTAAVVNALRQRLPTLQLTLRTALPREFLARRFTGKFEFTPSETDVGMTMDTALDIDMAATARAYARFHTDWEQRVQHEAQTLVHLAVHLVLADVPYLALAAAARAAIPAIAMCSLNWADIYAHYFHDRQPEAPAIYGQIRDAYQCATGFLQTEPSMPMANQPRRFAVGPVAQVGRNRQIELQQRLGLAPGTRLVMVSLGGVALRLPFERWPRTPNLHWLVPAAWGITPPGVSELEALDMPFTDVLRSADALVGKPGYGSFTEAACNGTPVLYVRRRDWPEEPYLVKWLEREGNCREIARHQLEQGDLAASLDALWQQPRRPPIVSRGIDEAVDYLLRHGLGADSAQVSHTLTPPQL
ncbi:MAG: hypothetical protein ACYC9J_05150 [Sulfuricaulis sp.]